MTIVIDAAQWHDEYSTFIEVLLVSADLMCFFAILDAYTEPLDVTVSREVANIVVDTLLNPNKARPTGERFIGTVAQQ